MRTGDEVSDLRMAGEERDCDRPGDDLLPPWTPEKMKPSVKSYLDYLREDCERRGVISGIHAGVIESCGTEYN
jgi:hypothetical protein